MALIDEIKILCDKLSDNGWDKLFDQFDMKIKANSTEELKTFLENDINIVDIVIGFEDTPLDNLHGITQGDPARSLLYHALASHNVISTEKIPLTYFPTLHEIELVENYVYGISTKTIEKILDSDLGDEFAVAVFAYEYRSAQDTPHKKHSDMCYSRTGIARVGTTAPHYDKKLRGFVPHILEQDGTEIIRVLPARYAAFIAVKNTSESKKRTAHMGNQNNDSELEFWTPIHKLFEGDECVSGISLQVDLNTLHVNEKIKRIHKEFARLGISNEYEGDKLKENPFVFTQRIASFSQGACEFGKHLLVPFTNNLVDIAKDENGENLYFDVPKARENPKRVNRTFNTSFEIGSIPRGLEPGWRHAPEYVNVRHEKINGIEENLNKTIEKGSDLKSKIEKGGYRALHYVDYTGEGWIKADYSQALKVKIETSLPAYSLVSAPDFFPYVDQREIFEWSKTLPADYRDHMWSIRKPEPLSDVRIPPNFELPDSNFDLDDKTFTVIVSSSVIPETTRNFENEKIPRVNRHRWLTDGAAGVFAPGWDVSVDGMTEDNEELTDNDKRKEKAHLATYGLGSPFPEDVKLCALLSTFWPAASPDVARIFDPLAEPRKQLSTSSPLTDDEVGLTEKPSWDGTTGPKKIDTHTIEFPSLEHTDYVDNALKNTFSLSQTSQVNFEEYARRTLNMIRVYYALVREPSTEFQRLSDSKRSMRILSFTKPNNELGELIQAQNDSEINLTGDVYRLEMFTFRGHSENQPRHQSKRHISVKKYWTVFVGDNDVLIKPDDGDWGADSTRID